MKNFFWLHIKKCGGESFRDTFTPPYVQTDRILNYKPFIALPKEEWNDALNNYRIPLGEYDYRRTLFAQKYLYTPTEFEQMFKFTIVRNPYDRILSAWKYLYRNQKNTFKLYLLDKKSYRLKNNYQTFLEELPEFWKYKKDRHIATHTAPIWPDISDESGHLLLDKIYKLETIKSSLIDISKNIGVSITKFSHINKNRNENSYRQFYTTRTRKLIEQLFAEDLEKLGYEF